jgi:glutathione S-transferase
VQDTADIIDHFEAAGLASIPAYPTRPLQRLVALTLDLFGGEGLTRPAMHYRWSFRAEQEAFLRHEFGLSFRARGLGDEQIAARLDAFMAYLNAYLPTLGVTPETIPAIEASYLDLLARLDVHFRAHPYALGGRPTVADYGLIAPLWAHLGRDPVPATLMKTRAPSVYRWTERMLACDPDTPEFPSYPVELPDDDDVPDTLRPVLQLVAADFLPELRMVVAETDAWLAAHSAVAPGTPAPETVGERAIATGAFELRGVHVTAAVMPYTLYMLQRVTDAFAELAAADARRVRGVFAAVGLDALLELRARRRVERRGHLEVWGA